MKIRELKFLTVAAVVALGLGLAGCGGGSDTAEAPPVVEPEPTPYEAAKANIAAATTAADAQAAYDAVKGDVTAAQGEMLQAAVDARVMAIETAARVAEQKMALTTAAGMIDTSDLSDADAIAAAQAAIDALQNAIDAAVDVDDTSMYESQVETAQMAVREAQTGLDTAGRMAMQRTAITNAVAAARTAVGMVDDGATDAQVTAADNAVAALKAAIDGAADIPEGDDDVASAQGTLATLEGQLATAKTSRTAAMDEADRKAAEAMAATAVKLHAGIYPPAADDTGTAVGDVHAAYNTGNTAIVVTTGDGTTANAATLTEDKKASVATLSGWTGKKYTHSVTSGDNKGDMYEAVVYSGVGMPTMGAKFSTQYPDTETFVTAGVVTLDTTGTDTPASRVAIDSFDLTAGTKDYKLPTSNPSGITRITEAGSFHGVRGTYSCAPVSGTPCTASKAPTGLTLAGPWTFKPTSADSRVTDVKDDTYASYGWWLHTAAGGSLTASAFTDAVGTATAAIGNLEAGTATYSGGAAGHYALSSSTGGTNDSGRFTARAMLEADFEDDMVTGTIDRFMGDDGMERNWTVELMKSGLGANGVITGDDGTGAAKMTKWTIDGTAAAAAGQWSGALLATEASSDTSGVPEVATGTFYSTYGSAGKMVGAFGANKQ